MAKKDSKKGKKIPKKIGGVKIPKELRHAGEALLDKANSPAGRELLASGLTMAAAAAAAAAMKQRAKAEAVKPGDPGIFDPQRVADKVGDVAEVVLDRLFGTKKST
ncbi:hypothetical protein ACM61V_08045 [Sphingomonas sp. TX0543]|uniref:hypothetical protein n=1 Tax=unclassified Sphingomonas TaxID=196159 RepID=UPI0010F5FC7A|nr:hypothetical protein [Sphingomonas sp. 3P27F8]